MRLFFPFKIKEKRNTKTDATQSYISIENRSRETVRLLRAAMDTQTANTI
ncbi:MAG: hypothetical protein NZ775_03685 [Gammaproteobacteria bacterium]|nr:hypothetical protein [Gammaproteobacteria bacterium]